MNKGGLAGLFDDEEFVTWSESHVSLLKKNWGKIDKTSQQYQFNKTWYGNVLKFRGNKFVLYVAKLGILHFSDFATIEAKSRGLL